MALVTKKYLIEQIRALIGTAHAGAKFEPRMIESFLQQAINRKLKTEYFSVTLPGDETIPEGLVLASYDAEPVVKYKGLSRVKLPAMPISLRRGMGVYFVGPSVSNLYLASNSLTPVVAGTSQINLTWTAIPNATSYYLERATDAAFTANLTPLYSGSLLGLSDTGLTVNTNYWYRVLGRATGYNDSVFTVATATTALITPIYDGSFDNSFN